MVGDRALRVGQFVSAGTGLLTVVPTGRDIYLVANFKETQTGHDGGGPAVTFTVDAFGEHAFQGRIESFSPGTGAQFALLPPENATGNFTKVVQRVPVRVSIDPSIRCSAPARRPVRRGDGPPRRPRRAGEPARGRPGRRPSSARRFPDERRGGVAAPEAKASRRDWLAVFGAILGAFTAILDIQITNASLADIQGALGASTEEGSWISTAYLMAEIIVIPLTGWLSSVIGLRRYLAVNTMLFTGFSLACALSTSLSQMILFRAGQGFTGGVLIPTAIVIVRTRLPKSQQPVGIALFGLTATFAPAIGPTVGGWLTDNLSWHYIFYLNLIFGPIAAAIQLGAFDTAPARWAELLRRATGSGSA